MSKVESKEGLIEGILCFDSRFKNKEIEKEWQRLGLGKFVPECRLIGTVLFHATKEDIILCQKKIRDGDTEMFSSVSPNRKVYPA